MIQTLWNAYLDWSERVWRKKNGTEAEIEVGRILDLELLVDKLNAAGLKAEIKNGTVVLKR